MTPNMTDRIMLGIVCASLIVLACTISPIASLVAGIGGAGLTVSVVIRVKKERPRCDDRKRKQDD